MTDPILGFFGAYRWMSNFHLKPVNYMLHTFPCNENAFMWAKGLGTEDPDSSKMVRFWTDYVEQPLDAERIVLPMYAPKEAKAMGRSLILRPDWEQVKMQVMFEINEAKYSSYPEKKWLLNTEDAYLEETNTWHDNFWGNCTCGRPECSPIGNNCLGEIIMEIRRRLQAGK